MTTGSSILEMILTSPTLTTLVEGLGGQFMRLLRP